MKRRLGGGWAVVGLLMGMEFGRRPIGLRILGWFWKGLEGGRTL